MLTQINTLPTMGRDVEPIVDPVRFLQATRDSGYRNFESALSELLDNSLQARADRIRIFLPVGATDAVAILDNGSGMDPAVLRRALQFGGSSRFNDRSGLGRYGMGLPNASLSQARRVDVYTWQGEEGCGRRTPRTIWHAYLDLDEVLHERRVVLASPDTVPALPPPFQRYRGKSGTLVIWNRLDRARPARWTTLVRRLDRRIGQAFRYFLWEGRRIWINGTPVRPADPLFLSSDTRAPWIAAEPYGDSLTYTIRCEEDGLHPGCSVVEVRFSELPIAQLTNLSNQEKRDLGIIGGAGVSVVRAGREIDYGWLLMDKRRENYDDWWRCEIRFSPELDEMFGVSHTKQGVRPMEQLRRVLCGELGAVARTLNRRVRMTHLALSQERERNIAARTATERDKFLRPVALDDSPTKPDKGVNASAPELGGDTLPRLLYDIRTEELPDRSFCRMEMQGGRVTIILNTMHEFYRNIYHPLLDDAGTPHRRQWDLLLLAFARTQALGWSEAEQATLDQFLQEWSRALTVFCGGQGYAA